MIIDNKTFIETVASNLVNDIYDNLGDINSKLEKAGIKILNVSAHSFRKPGEVPNGSPTSLHHLGGAIDIGLQMKVNVGGKEHTVQLLEFDDFIDKHREELNDTQKSIFLNGKNPPGMYIVNALYNEGELLDKHNLNFKLFKYNNKYDYVHIELNGYKDWCKQKFGKDYDKVIRTGEIFPVDDYITKYGNPRTLSMIMPGTEMAFDDEEAVGNYSMEDNTIFESQQIPKRNFTLFSNLTSGSLLTDEEYNMYKILNKKYLESYNTIMSGANEIEETSNYIDSDNDKLYQKAINNLYKQNMELRKENDKQQEEYNNYIEDMNREPIKKLEAVNTEEIITQLTDYFKKVRSQYGY